MTRDILLSIPNTSGLSIANIKERNGMQAPHDFQSARWHSHSRSDPAARNAVPSCGTSTFPAEAGCIRKIVFHPATLHLCKSESRQLMPACYGMAADVFTIEAFSDVLVFSDTVHCHRFRTQLPGILQFLVCRQFVPFRASSPCMRCRGHDISFACAHPVFLLWERGGSKHAAFRSGHLFNNQWNIFGNPAIFADSSHSVPKHRQGEFVNRA